MLIFSILRIRQFGGDITLKYIEDRCSYTAILQKKDITLKNPDKIFQKTFIRIFATYIQRDVPFSKFFCSI